MMHNKLIAGLVLLLLAQSGHAEYRPQLLGKALGEYIAAADFISLVKDSECHQLVAPSHATKKQILVDAHLVLRRSDYQQITKYLEGAEYNNSIRKTYETAAEQSKLIGHTKELACEYLYTNFHILYKFTRDKWHFAEKFHSR